MRIAEVRAFDCRTVSRTASHPIPNSPVSTLTASSSCMNLILELDFHMRNVRHAPRLREVSFRASVRPEMFRFPPTPFARTDVLSSASDSFPNISVTNLMRTDSVFRTYCFEFIVFSFSNLFPFIPVPSEPTVFRTGFRTV